MRGAASARATASGPQPFGRRCRPLAHRRGLRSSLRAQGTGDQTARYTPEQLAFMERKRKFLAGEGPAMPVQSECTACNGTGRAVCFYCHGTGVNGKDVQDIMHNGGLEQVRSTNGVQNVLYFLMKGGPCFVCRGDPTVPCRECEGSGVAGGITSKYGGD